VKTGTKSVLFGAHQFLIHPCFVFFAWWKLYGFPWDPRLWLAFFLHDLGYLGKPNMDGPEGERHPEFAARVMGFFGAEWHDFCLYHSRFYAKRDGRLYSRLCVADKLSIVFEPWWLYLPRVVLSGEVYEYMSMSGNNKGSKYQGEPNDKYVHMQLETGTIRGWFNAVTHYLRQWVFEHKDLKKDTWTPDPIARKVSDGTIQSF